MIFYTEYPYNVFVTLPIAIGIVSGLHLIIRWLSDFNEMLKRAQHDVVLYFY